MVNLCLISTLCLGVVNSFADYSVRISELKAEDEILEQREIQYNQALNNIRVRRIEIQGIIKELESMKDEKIAENPEEMESEGTDKAE